MSNRSFLLSTGALALAAMLSACGGGGAGGGGGVASIPPPPPPPPPPPTESVAIFANPTPQTFASVGIAATSGSNSLSSSNASVPHIRYTAGGDYEIQMPGASWERLVFAKNAIPQDPATFNYFQPQSAFINGAYLITSVAKTQGFKYSELASWWDGGTHSGSVAFGSATPAGGVPTSGSATYHGIVDGISDISGFDSFDGNFKLAVNGTVQLTFDFGKGALDGAMDLTLANIIDIGHFTFTDTVFSAGNGTYSGKFSGAASGQNFFLGQLTGPNAEETIGAWAVPFQFTKGTTDIPADGKIHQVYGGWIAK